MVSNEEHGLKLVSSFIYFGKTVTSNVNMDTQINKTIGRAVGVMRRLRSRLWENRKLEAKRKMEVHRTSVLSVLLFVV